MGRGNRFMRELVVLLVLVGGGDIDAILASMTSRLRVASN